VSIPWRVCPQCLRLVMVLITPQGHQITVDPTPTVDGPLLVNGLAGRVVGQTPGSGPGHREVGWWPHPMVCSRWLPPRRPDVPLPRSAPPTYPAPTRGGSYEAITRVREPSSTRRRVSR